MKGSGSKFTQAEMGVGLQVWKLGLRTSWRPPPEIKERMRGLGNKGIDVGGRESGTKTEHCGVQGKREMGPGSHQARRETGALYLVGVWSKCCAQCIVRKSSAKGTLFLNAFMGVDYFQWLHSSSELASAWIRIPSFQRWRDWEFPKVTSWVIGGTRVQCGAPWIWGPVKLHAMLKSPPLPLHVFREIPMVPENMGSKLNCIHFITK